MQFSSGHLLVGDWMLARMGKVREHPDQHGFKLALVPKVANIPERRTPIVAPVSGARAVGSP
jgi:hypothetical protein